MAAWGRCCLPRALAFPPWELPGGRGKPKVFAAGKELAERMGEAQRERARASWGGSVCGAQEKWARSVLGACASPGLSPSSLHSVLHKCPGGRVGLWLAGEPFPEQSGPLPHLPSSKGRLLSTPPTRTGCPPGGLTQLSVGVGLGWPFPCQPRGHRAEGRDGPLQRP